MLLIEWHTAFGRGYYYWDERHRLSKLSWCRAHKTFHRKWWIGNRSISSEAHERSGHCWLCSTQLPRMKLQISKCGLRSKPHFIIHVFMHGWILRWLHGNRTKTGAFTERVETFRSSWDLYLCEEVHWDGEVFEALIKFPLISNNKQNYDA